MSTPARRSGRERKVTSKYLETVWDKETLRILRESSESSGSSPSAESVKESEKTDNEFEVRGLEDAEDSSSSSSDTGGLSDASSGPALALTFQSDEDAISVTSHDTRTPTRKRTRLSTTVGTISKDPGAGRSRGIEPVHRKSSKHVVFPKIFGPDIADLKPILYVRDTWLNGRDVTLPSRTTLQKLPSHVNEDNLLTSWSIDTGTADFIRHQIGEVIDLDVAKARNYLITKDAEQSVALGNAGEQKLFPVEYLHGLDVSKAWEEAAISCKSPGTHTSPEITNNNKERGWILNAGEKVQCLTWLPFNDNTTQLLAIACRATSLQRSSLMPTYTRRSPAFYPSTDYSNCIQLWCVDDCGHRGPHLSTTGRISSPSLKTLYAVDIGDIRELQWQPVPISATTNVIAALSTNGSVSLLSLSTTQPLNLHVAYIHIKSPALQFSPPSDTVFTSMSWASTMDLIIGDSTGAAHVYNIAGQSTPVPYLTVQLHSTYIMNIVSTFPSSTPTIVASTSASGDVLLTDLRAPNQDRVHIHKARLPTKPLIYSHLTRSFIYPSETSGITDPRTASAPLIICNNLRHFHHNLQICRLPNMSGSVTALASSPHHPCILLANTKGSVFATNHARRTLPIKGREKEFGGFLQKILDYDWRPISFGSQSANLSKNVEVTAEKKKIDLHHGHDVRPGISRFTEGFKPEPIDLTSGGSKNPRFQRNTPRIPRGAGATKAPDTRKATRRAAEKARKEKRERASELAAEMVFEEEQAVTTLQWNPNRRFAGWVAMGWGSGIVRVMDLSHDSR